MALANCWQKPAARLQQEGDHGVGVDGRLDVGVVGESTQMVLDGQDRLEIGGRAGGPSTRRVGDLVGKLRKPSLPGARGELGDRLGLELFVGHQRIAGATS